MPAVSVVIPAYNAERYLGAAVDSVLAQSFQDLEIVVIDDGSNDGTAEVVERYDGAVRYIRQDNRGVAAARNLGIEKSIGQYVAFLDADDTWFREKLGRQMRKLVASSGHRACYSAHVVCDERLKPLSVRRSMRTASSLEDLLLRGNVVGNICTVVVERSLLVLVGGFDPSFSQCADWDLWIRLATATEFLYVDEPLVAYRQHGSNMSRDAELLERDSVRVLEKAFRSGSVPAVLRAQRRRAMGRNYMVLAGTYFHAGRYRDFLRCAVLSVALDPGQTWYLAGYPQRRLRRLWRGGRPVGQWR